MEGALSMAEVWELIAEKVMHWLFVCVIVAAVILLGVAIWHLVVYHLTRSRVDSAKQIYNAIKLGESKEKAIMLFRSYTGVTDQYKEEALLTTGRHEETLCLLFAFGRGESGEIRLTYIDDVLVEKRQNGIW